jgi:hypothetical protein
MFADDLKLLAKIRCVQDSVDLQADLDRAVEWSEKWQASFNTKKCIVIHAGDKNPGYQYTMSNPMDNTRIILESKAVERDLGILIASNLKWDHRETRKSPKSSDENMPKTE